MCGISGIVNLKGGFKRQDQLKLMTDLITHRGPDDFGFFIEGSVGFGHRRLSILDLSSAGNQPMKFSEDLVITYNGEIYNYIEIRQTLIEKGYKFQSNTDTEVILAAYAEWGKECVHQFNGMWAFAIYDRKKHTVFLSRDRFGIKPLYFLKIDDELIFGSEIKQLLLFVKVNKVNKKTLLNYLIYGMEEYNEDTFFEGVCKLLPGHNLTIDIKKGVLEQERFYTLKKHPSIERLNEQDSILHWRKKFTQSINLRLRSDVDVGTCLSGGLDSSSIAAKAGKTYFKNRGKAFKAITAESVEKINDESAYAKKVVDFIGLDWKKVKPDKESYKEVVEKVIALQEEPFGSPSIIMQYFVMQKAKEINCTVLLDGQGGDETLLGYERYYPAYFLSLPFWRSLMELFKSSSNSKLSVFQLLKYHVYFTNAKIRKKRQVKRCFFVKKSSLNFLKDDALNDLAKSYRNIWDLQVKEITSTQLPHLLKYEDKNSMYHSIETRLPFLDYQLVEASLSIKNSLKINGGWTKYILRKSIENDLPQEITWRKNKFGFEAPVKTWLSDKDELRKVISSSQIIKSLCHDSVKTVEDISLLWKLYNIAIWEKIYNVKVD